MFKCLVLNNTPLKVSFPSYSQGTFETKEKEGGVQP